MRVVDINPADIQRYRDTRLIKVKSATVRRELGYISSVLGYAVSELHIIPSNPCEVITKPAPSKDRYRRITQADVDEILIACEYAIGDIPTQGKHWVAWAFIWAIAKTDIKDLQFRDTRHEAISRFVRVQKLPVEIVAKITGHKKIETLLNVYYNPTADELYEAMYGDK